MSNTELTPAQRIGQHLETATREQVAANPDVKSYLSNIVATCDKLRAEGRTIEFRLDQQRQIPVLVEIEQVTVNLDDVEEAPEA